MTITTADTALTDSATLADSFTDVASDSLTRIPKPTVLPLSNLDSLNSHTPSPPTQDVPPKRVSNDSFRRISRRRDSKQFLPLARWEGTVIERYDSHFVAEVIDLDSDESATAEFDIIELTPGDIPLCEPGSLFYWTIGYDIKEGGQRSRVSVLRFRRLGRISK
ncbi:hypothetical protein ACFYXF_25085 [Streptomyces sp. NPDC002680]|uniref:hypothetical protein n=1 Tax=Streptomyces sp. NPDC002680 TaxID=3364659 RepID=UPI0036CCF37B